MHHPVDREDLDDALERAADFLRAAERVAAGFTGYEIEFTFQCLLRFAA